MLQLQAAAVSSGKVPTQKATIMATVIVGEGAAAEAKTNRYSQPHGKNVLENPHKKDESQAGPEAYLLRSATIDRVQFNTQAEWVTGFVALPIDSNNRTIPNTIRIIPTHHPIQCDRAKSPTAN
jgi:hypothetical protein